ncbi:MAG TPA: protein translocase subunit SecD [Verrucomicrobiae bacterium]|jgi:preprotein translocase subunit SecD|nr:protein translocase subunit SecD [Verrucomicrobiae bacterium]
MQKNLGTKLAIIVAVMLAFTALIFLGNDWGKSIPAIKEQGLVGGLKQSINLGLDLKGGTHMILQVMVDEAIGAESDRAMEQLKDQLKKKGLTFTDFSKPDSATIVVKGLTPDGGLQLRTIAQDFFADYDVVQGAEGSWKVVMKPTRQTAIKQDTLAKSIEAIRNRVDSLGVSEPVIQENGLGNYQILVQLPGVDDPARVKEIIQTTARLELHGCQSVSGYASAAEALGGGVLPSDQILVPGKSVGSQTQDTERVYLVSRVPVVGGTDVRDAQAGRKPDTNQPNVSFSLTAAAGRTFGEWTSTHNEAAGSPNTCLAIVLDNRVIEAASVRNEIRDQGSIDGGFTDQTAQDLAIKLRSGALPASLKNLSESNVGPSLGADSIRSGVKAAIGGMLAVMIFMLIYYRGAGVNADLAIIFNLILLLGCMGLFGAVLTLPGIAGVILTVGMGVDSNVLIFERIREELRQGKTPAAAVDQGFSKAWTTILDTHVTTVVSALILFLVGKGPVSGFGLTLIIGLLANLFTAVFVSRVIFDFILSRKERGAALSI